MNTRSAGWEVNDISFLRRSDYIWHNANVLRQWTTPTRWYRQLLAIAGGQQQFNLDGNLTDRVSGRNSSRADSVGTIDFAVERQISLAKQTSIALRMEAFNLLNTTSFGIPVRILESPGFGKAFDTQVNSRSIRFVAKVQF